MLRAKTVFVVGAGASNEVGLPVGSQLKRIIYDKLDFRRDAFGHPDPSYGDRKIFDWIRRSFPSNANSYLSACSRIRDGISLSASVDDFIDVHREDKELALCGKLAIAKAILESENTSALSYDTSNVYNTIEFQKLEKTWYAGFFRLLNEGLSKADRQRIFHNVTVISFNYDRCIEHFLVHALAAHYQIERDEARELTFQLPIFYPFGSVGNYINSARRVISFGSAESSDLEHALKDLKTYTEQIGDDERLNKIRAAIAEAHVIVFLGNAFHPNNMALLTPEAGTAGRKKIYSTRYGISDADLSVVKKQLTILSGSTTKYIPSPIEDYFFSEKCHQLFEAYRMSLRL